MGNNAVEDGWQRFLERLRRLWGRVREGRAASPINVAAPHVAP
jgi:hypothetical protein